MQAQLQRIEVEPAVLGDHDFAIEHATRGQLRAQADRAIPESSDSSGFSSRLWISISSPSRKIKRAKAVPFGFEDPFAFFRQCFDASSRASAGRAG